MKCIESGRSSPQRRSLAQTLCWALCASFLLGGAGTATAQSVGELDALNAKKSAQAASSLAKSEKKEAKLSAKIALQQTQLAGLQASLAAAQAAAPALAATLAAAMLDLSAAQDLPAVTPEQKGARKSAIKLAKKAFAQAQKAVKKNASATTKLQKKGAKLIGKMAKVQGKLDTLAAVIAGLQNDLDKLEGDFGFVALDQLGAQVTVLDGDGLPVPFAHITISDSLELPRNKKGVILPFVLEDIVTPAVYAQGFTDALGVFQLPVHLPPHRSSFDVIVDKSGLSGTYTEETLRSEWGVFAPSARITVGTFGLASVSVSLQEMN